MIKRIEIDGLLSFEKFELELRNLNVLIGPNGSGKSNLIEVLGLLQALPTDLRSRISRGGGIDEWLRKSRQIAETGALTARIAPPQPTWMQDLTYHVALGSENGRHVIAAESLETEIRRVGEQAGVRVVELKNGRGNVLAFEPPGAEWEERQHMARPLASVRDSVLYEIRDAELFPEVSTLASTFTSMRLYADWEFGHGSPPRRWQPTDLPVDFLTEGQTNVALVVNELINSGAEETINSEFGRFYERFRRFSVAIFGNQVILRMHEDGVAEPVPATRWSDGMIHYLCLLAILCHPNLPPLICLDEPELGFHPDVLPHLARLIEQASERTQVIITTHSADLVDHFSDDPQAVVVCERGFDGATQMTRQDAKRLKKWLKDYTLGELWRSGEIGGNPF